jgi:hypothetical protein
VAIAYAWKNGKSQKEMATVDLSKVVKKRPMWLDSFSVNEMEMNKNLLPKLQRLFA